MSCSCNNRIQGTGSFFTPIFGAIGGAFRVAAPVLLPTAIGIGTEFLINKIVPKPKESSPSTPAPLAPAVEQAQTEQREAKISLGVGAVVVAGLALYLLTKRRR